MAILMLCDTPVYDTTTDTVLNRSLCPFICFTDTKKAYEQWRVNRSYLRSNRIAEQIVDNAGGSETREAKRRLSLSDGYWIKYSYDRDTLFEAITPYTNVFSDENNKRSSSVPELTLGGSQPKNWKRGPDGLTYIEKFEDTDQVNAEMLAIKLARLCCIPVMNAFVETDGGRIYADEYTSEYTPEVIGNGVINLVNMTDVRYSLLPFDQVGITVRGTDPDSVAAAYAKAGAESDLMVVALLQVVFDGIVGNVDRETNNSNWAVFMDNKTGVRSQSWLYDFNWANLWVENVFGIKTVASHIKRAGLEKLAIRQAEHIGSKCTELGLIVWESNAQRLIAELS